MTEAFRILCRTWPDLDCHNHNGYISHLHLPLSSNLYANGMRWSPQTSI